MLGGNGFVGREVCRLAVQRGFQALFWIRIGKQQVTSLSRRGENPEPGNEDLEQVNWVKGDATDYGTVSSQVNDADAVVHAAWTQPEPKHGLRRSSKTSIS